MFLIIVEMTICYSIWMLKEEDCYMWPDHDSPMEHFYIRTFHVYFLYDDIASEAFPFYQIIK